jgi:hypothetical protein
MQVPLDLTFKNFKDDGRIESLVKEKVEKIEQACPNMISCHVFIEQLTNHKYHQQSHHVRIAIAFPPNHEVIINREPLKGKAQGEFLTTILRDAFIAARRRIQEINSRTKGHARVHHVKPLTEKKGNQTVPYEPL